MASSSIRIGLLWHSANSGNLGVGALTVANMELARQAAAQAGLEPRFLIMGMGDEGPPYVAGCEAYVINTRRLLGPKGFWSVVGDQDVILDIGAGDSFAEIYGFQRFLFLWLTKAMAVIRGVPLLMSPQTVGPFTRYPYVQMASWVMKRARAVVARDELSLALVERLAPETPRLLSADVAFALPYEDRSRGRGGKTLKVGLNVSGLLFNEAVSGRNRFGLQSNYADLMRAFIAGQVARPDVEVHLLAHVATVDGGWDDDSSVADQLAIEFPSAIRVPNFDGPSQAKSYISGLDFLAAGRMHACIAAYSSGTPVVPIAYSRKFSGLFSMLDYPWLVPVSGLDTAAALDYLNDCLDRRQDLARDARRGLAKVEALLNAYRTELVSLFAEMAPPR
jgi:colanic acid/amylovoran biosynthesis protein